MGSRILRAIGNDFSVRRKLSRCFAVTTPKCHKSVPLRTVFVEVRIRPTPFPGTTPSIGGDCSITIWHYESKWKEDKEELVHSSRRHGIQMGRHRKAAKCSGMMSSRMASAVLLIGGCTQREEGGALRSVEELSFQQTADGVDVASRIVGELQEARRSPAVFAENGGFLVIGGCQRKGVHARSAERMRWSQDSLESNGPLFQNVVEAQSCAVSLKLEDSTGLLIGGFNGVDCLKCVQLVKLNEDEVSSTSPPDIPFRLKNSTGVKVSDTEVLLFGGWDESSTMKAVFRLCFENSNTSYTIKMESILPYEVEGHCCAFHNGYVYIIGGYDGISVVDTIIRYNVSDGTSEILPTRLSTARENHVCEIIFDRYVVVMAGWDGQQALDLVEIFEISEGSPFLIPTGNRFNLCQKRNRPASIAIDL